MSRLRAHRCEGRDVIVGSDDRGFRGLNPVPSESASWRPPRRDLRIGVSPSPRPPASSSRFPRARRNSRSWLRLQRRDASIGKRNLDTEERDGLYFAAQAAREAENRISDGVRDGAGALSRVSGIHVSESRLTQSGQDPHAAPTAIADRRRSTAAMPSSMPGAPRDFPRPPLRHTPGLLSNSVTPNPPQVGEGSGRIALAAQATQVMPSAREAAGKEEN
jgi:hypothetical protein